MRITRIWCCVTGIVLGLVLATGCTAGTYGDAGSRVATSAGGAAGVTPSVTADVPPIPSAGPSPTSTATVAAPPATTATVTSGAATTATGAYGASPTTSTPTAGNVSTTNTAAVGGSSASTGATASGTVVSLPPSLPRGAPTLRVPILMYHFVDSSPPPAGRWSAGLTVPTDEFRKQMDYLAEAGFTPVTLEDVYAAMAGLGKLPAKPVAITFDDGNKDNFTVAFPILREHSFVATFFVITGFVGNRLSVTWDDLEAMQAAGMAIESHTVTHPDLRRLDAAGLERELAGSREALAAHLGATALVIAYPAGAYNARVVQAVRAAGYLVAVTTHSGDLLDPTLTCSWPRVRVHEGVDLKNVLSE